MFLHPQIPDFQILSKPYINVNIIYSAFRWCINLNFTKLTHMTDFVLQGHILLQTIECNSFHTNMCAWHDCKWFLTPGLWWGRSVRVWYVDMCLLFESSMSYLFSGVWWRADEATAAFVPLLVKSDFEQLTETRSSSFALSFVCVCQYDVNQLLVY